MRLATWGGGKGAEASNPFEARVFRNEISASVGRLNQFRSYETQVTGKPAKGCKDKKKASPLFGSRLVHTGVVLMRDPKLGCNGSRQALQVG